jgi:hypothetical protein
MSTAHNPDQDHLYYDSENNGIVAHSDIYYHLMEAALQDPHVASVLEQVDEAKRKSRNATIIYPKWTCGGCGERATANVPGQFHYLWNHEEKLDGQICGYKTLIAEGDLGYAIVLRSGTGAALVAEPSGQGSLVEVHGEGEQADEWRAKLMDAAISAGCLIPDGNRRFGPGPTTEP